MNSSSYKYFLGLLMAVAVVLGGYVVYGYYSKKDRGRADRTSSTRPVELNFPVGDFTLTDRFGKEFHASDLKGEVWVASFFYTDCAGACLMLNSTIADLIKKDFPDDPVKFVSISVDPQKDNLDVINRYAGGSYVEARGIDPERWIFLTEPEGKEYKIEEIANGNFKVGFGKITHSDRLIVVDREGIVRATVSSAWDREVERFKTTLREILDEGNSSVEPDDAKAESIDDSDATDSAAVDVTDSSLKKNGAND